MSEAVLKIVRFERRVMWRRRLLSLQDGFALAVMMSGFVGGGGVALWRLRPIAMPVWPVILTAVSLSIAAALTHWFLTRASESETAFLIDESLNLEDRVVTSRLVIERGGPSGRFEEALIEDAAQRLGNLGASTVVPHKTRSWYIFSLVSMIGLAVALLLPARSIPANDALAAVRADIESAGEHLEQTAAEVGQAAPPGSETWALAKEQGEVGRGFRRSIATRAEALKRLSALEERIRRRHDDLASTRADEIVSLADRRLGSALSTLPTPRRTGVEPVESALPASQPPGASRDGSRQGARATDPRNARKFVQYSGKDQQRGDAKGGEKASDQNSADRKANDSQSTELPAGSLDAPKAVDVIAEQAARSLPNVSEELLKKAAELRANELSPADIERLRKAAESLSRDLSQIAQSKEIQKALQEMSHQIRPEQIEQVARQLGNQEQLKKELDAAARLLSENRQAKEMVGGLSKQLGRIRDEKRRQDDSESRGRGPEALGEGSRSGNAGSPGSRPKASAAIENFNTAVDRRYPGQGREASLKGKLQQGSGGEYLYLQSNAGVGAVRAPYSSAYPQYRREAERAVQRSQVPPGLRSVIRKYFDAINPDAKR